MPFLISVSEDLPTFSWWKSNPWTNYVSLKVSSFFSTQTDNFSPTKKTDVNSEVQSIYQRQSPWTRDVGRFHGTLDINAPPSQQVKKSVLSHKSRCVHALCRAIMSTFTLKMQNQEKGGRVKVDPLFSKWQWVSAYSL